MVVLLILAILLAIAIPTFLGVTKTANDRAAQSNLESALTNAKAIFQQNNQSYALTTVGATYVTSNGTLMAASLFGAVPNLTFTTGAVTAANSNTPAAVSVAVVDNNGIALAEQAKGTNNCWFVIDNAATEAWTTSGTGSQPNAMGTWYGESKGATTCNASSVPAPNGTTIVYQQAGFPSL
jgi:type IV pilus assembly protein PilA